MPHLKVGVFGASFDPPHLGHLNLVQQVFEKFSLDRIIAIPIFKNPFREKTLEASAHDRLEITYKVFQDHSFIEVDDREIRRRGVSYTIDTINELLGLHKELFLIIGMDQLMLFDQWKDFEDILQKVHLIVCQRSDFHWKKELFPLKIQNFVDVSQRDVLVLKTGRKIFFQKLKGTVDITSTNIRQRVRAHLSIHHLVPPVVERWIEAHKLYRDLDLHKSKLILEFCANTLINKKAERVKAFDFRSFSKFPFQFTLVVSGLNTRHTQSLAKELKENIKKQFSLTAIHVEGLQTGNWIVLDYGFLVIHIFYHYIREYYSLEELWKQAFFRNFSSSVA